jgi:hypothetical protein
MLKNINILIKRFSEMIKCSVVALTLMLVSLSAACDEGGSWKASYLKVESDELKVLNIDNKTSMFKFGLFINENLKEYKEKEKFEDEEFEFTHKNIGYSLSYQMKF